MNTHALKVGAYLVLLYIACLLWRVLMIDPVVVNFHLLALKTAFPGFGGYDAFSIVWGALLSFGYGALGSYVFHSLHADCCRSKSSEKNREKESMNTATVLWVVAALIIGVALGLFFGRPSSPFSKEYLSGSATMMRGAGSSMQEFGEMMKSRGRMMQEWGGKYNDQDMMQQGRDMMERGEQHRGEGSDMMERGNGMMNMMR